MAALVIKNLPDRMFAAGIRILLVEYAELRIILLWASDGELGSRRNISILQNRT
jgi:hypothetical protein